MGRKKKTVIVKSRQDRDVHGIVVKEWQRLPKQLIGEYCQRNKRPKPQYKRVFSEEGYRSRITLPDPKVKAKDISLTTNEFYSNRFDAESAVALLVLSVVDGKRQYEKTLPEKFGNAWLLLTGREKKLFKSNDTKHEHICKFCQKSFKKEHGLSQHEKKEHKEELAKILEGEDQLELVEEELSCKVSIEAETSAALNISARGMYKSQHERQQAMLERKQYRNKKRHSKEIFKRANRYARIIVSSENKGLLQKLCFEYLQRLRNDNQETRVDTKSVQSLERLGFSRDFVVNELKAFKNNEICVIAYAIQQNNELPKVFQPSQGSFEKIGSLKTLELIRSGLNSTLIDCLESFEKEKLSGFEQYCKVLNIETPPLQSFVEEVLFFFKDNFSDKKSTIEEEDSLDIFEEEYFALESIIEDKVTVHKENIEDMNGSYIVLSFNNDIGFMFKLWVSRGSVSRSCYPSFPILVDFKCSSRNSLISLDKSCQCFQEISSNDLLKEPHLYHIYEFARELGTSEKYWTKLSKYSFDILTFKDKSDKQLTKKTPPRVNRKSFREVKPQSRRIEQDQGIINKFKILRETSEFKRRQKERETLPANKCTEELMPMLMNDQLIIVKGETGCGKTTQIPQILLHKLLETEKTDFNIVCTQPRRVAAIGVANRVVYENNSSIGDLIGYHIRHDCKVTKNTRLSFLTIGILLRQFINDREMNSVTHLIIDEVHERSKDIDFLLALLQKLLKKRPKLKIILMSATIDEKIFMDYFKGVTEVQTISIPGRTFPVTNYFVDDLPQLFPIVLNEPTAKALPRVNYGLIKRVLRYISALQDGAVLVFLPGVGEISRLQKDLQAIFPEFIVVPLHSQLKAQLQMKCFNPVPKGKRKIVLATNIAETSVTIQDIVFVIDSGLEKQTTFNSITKFTKLETNWISKASAKQRRGRAGRVTSGFCFKIFYKATFKEMEENSVPEIKRISIDKLVLESIEVIKDDAKKASVQEFIQTFIEPPEKKEVKDSLSFLSLVGAIDKSETTTALGKYLVQLPVNILAGKMMIYGCLLDLSYESIVIAAGLSVKSLFRMPDSNLSFEGLKESRKVLFKEQHIYLAKSDHIMLLNVFLKFEGLNFADRKDFCNKFQLNLKSLVEMEKLVKEFVRLTKLSGFNVKKKTSLNFTKETVLMLKAVICAGLFPSLSNIVMPSQQYVKTISGIKEKDAEAYKIKYFAKRKDKDTSSRLFLHPTSLNYTTQKYDSPWLAYSEVFQTSKPFMRQTTNISPYSILFFGGDAFTDYENGLIVFDEWMKFRIKPRLAVLLALFKRIVDEYLLSILDGKKSLDNALSSQVVRLMRTLIIGAGFHI